MEERCPDAWLFNITNPMTALTRVGVPGDQHQDRRALPRGGQLLHGPGHRLGRPFEAVSASVTGVNHFPVLTSLEVDGADGFDVLRKLVDEVGGLASLAPYPGARRPRSSPSSTSPSATSSS